jgi:hypothetical protein
MSPNAFPPFLLAGLARPRRWIVLAAAILLGYAAAGGFAGQDRSSRPVELPTAIAGFLVGAAHAQATAPAAPAMPTPPDAGEKRDGASEGTKSHGASIGVTIDDSTGRVRIASAGTGDHEYDSFEAFVQQAPWIAGLVFAVTFLVFLTPILIVALVVWYKMRKNRMLNETLVKLAEKGVVPPAEALGAIATGRQSAAIEAGPSTAPLYDQAREIRRKVVWSDLRKGIIAGAVGLGFTFYSMLDDGSPNFLGLVLLFVGLGYVVLWYFEDRQVERRPGPPAA